MRVTKVKNKVTGEILNAVYAATQSGNLRYHINGVPYSDKKFDKLFEMYNPDGEVNPNHFKPEVL